MENDKLKKISNDSRKLLMKHFPFEGHRDLVILKGHLLILQILWKHIEMRVSYPEAFEDPHRISPYSIICFAQSLDPNLLDRWVWKAAKDLNAIRNKLAHRLEDKKIDDDIDKFTKSVYQSMSAPFDKSRDHEKQLRIAIISLIHLLGDHLYKLKDLYEGA